MKKAAKPADLVIVLPSLNAGGTERVVSILANHWASQGQRVALILTEAQRTTFYCLHPSIVVDHAATGSFGRLLKRIPVLASVFLVLYLRRKIKQSRTFRVLSFLPGPNVLALLATLNLQMYTIISERNDIRHRHLPWIWRQLRRITYPKASKILINLESNRSILADWCDVSKIVWIPNPIFIANLLNGHQRRPKVFLAVGRLTKQKAFHLLIKAFGGSRCPKLGWELQIIGEGDEYNELRRQILDLRLDNQVSISPVVEDIWLQYQTFEYFVMTSDFEGTPNALLEAISSGMIPIVSEGVGDIAHEIRTLEPRLVFPRGDSNKLIQIFDQVSQETKFNYDVINDANQIITPYRLEYSMPIWTNEVFGYSEPNN